MNHETPNHSEIPPRDSNELSLPSEEQFRELHLNERLSLEHQKKGAVQRALGFLWGVSRIGEWYLTINPADLVTSGHVSRSLSEVIHEDDRNKLITRPDPENGEAFFIKEDYTQRRKVQSVFFRGGKAFPSSHHIHTDTHKEFRIARTIQPDGSPVFSLEMTAFEERGRHLHIYFGEERPPEFAHNNEDNRYEQKSIHSRRPQPVTAADINLLNSMVYRGLGHRLSPEEQNPQK